jgi:hypothetical protein
MGAMRVDLVMVMPVAIALSGCVDYLNHRDSVTLAAGDAMHANAAIQTINPMPPAAYKKTIDYDGQAALTTVSPGSAYMGGGGYGGNCLHSDNLDAAGHQCGGRSADSRLGGQGIQ